MQKHQEWMDNRNYEHHLKSLQGIQTQNRTHFLHTAHPKNNRKNNPRIVIRPHSIEDDLADPNSPEPPQQSLKSKPLLQSRERSRSPKKKKGPISIKQKQLLWDNYLLGKRIIETNSVINMRKNEHDYNRFKKILDSRTQRNKKQRINDEFRLSKLHEYAEVTSRIHHCIRLPTSTGSRQLLSLRILDMRFNKQRLIALSDVALRCETVKGMMKGDGQKPTHSHVQTSELVSIVNLPVFQFYFRLPGHHMRRLRQKQNSVLNRLILTLCDVKGLEQRSVASFEINEAEVLKQPTKKMCRLMKLGRQVGEVDLQFYCISKKMLVSSLGENID